MRKFAASALATAGLLALPALAHAKELTGLEVCGPEGCEFVAVTGFGHRGPFTDESLAGPPPGSFYRLSLEVDGHADAWIVFYEPGSRLVASSSGQGWMTWHRLDPAIAKPVEQAVKSVAPFPTPTVTAVRIGNETADDPGSYLRLFTAKGPFTVPSSGERDAIRLDGPVKSPWTPAIVMYYSEDDVLSPATGQYVRLSADLAADIEAARSLTAGSSPLLPLFGLAAILAALGLVALVGMLRARRRAVRRVLAAGLGVVLALALAAAAQAKELARVQFCGPNACTTIEDPARLRQIELDGDSTIAPPAAAPFYTMRMNAGGQGGDASQLYYVPSAAATAWYDGSGRVLWFSAPAMSELVAGLEPFAAPRLASVRIGDRVVTDDPSSYLYLLELPAAARSRSPAKADWVPIDLQSARPSPWTDSPVELAYSPSGQLVERGAEQVRVSDALAADIEADRPLDAGGGSVLPWLALAVAAALAAVSVAGTLLLRRRTPRQVARPRPA